MKRQVLFCHPDDHNLTFTGFGRKPKWLEAFEKSGGTLEQAAQAAVRAGYRTAASLPADSVTVTKSPVADQAQLPGLPELPKKRGRPTTGKAISDLERKRRSRENAYMQALERPETATITGLLEALSKLHAYHQRGKDYGACLGPKICRELTRRFEAMAAKHPAPAEEI